MGWLIVKVRLSLRFSLTPCSLTACPTPLPASRRSDPRYRAARGASVIRPMTIAADGSARRTTCGDTGGGMWQAVHGRTAVASSETVESARR